MSLKIRTNYSPNFDLRKRKKTNIEFLIFHYTGMKYEKDAINKLTDIKSKVSSHYFINKAVKNKLYCGSVKAVSIKVNIIKSCDKKSQLFL